MDTRHELKEEKVFAEINDFLNKTIRAINVFIESHIEELRDPAHASRERLIALVKSIYQFAEPSMSESLLQEKIKQQLNRYLETPDIQLYGVGIVLLNAEKLASTEVNISCKHFHQLIRQLKVFNDPPLIKLSGKSINKINHHFRDLMGVKREATENGHHLLPMVSFDKHFFATKSDPRRRAGKSYLLLEVAADSSSPIEVLQKAHDEQLAHVQVFSSRRDVQNWQYKNEKKGVAYIAEITLAKQDVLKLLQHKKHQEIYEHIVLLHVSNDKSLAVRFKDDKFELKQGITVVSSP